jgi:hypothetical protein
VGLKQILGGMPVIINFHEDIRPFNEYLLDPAFWGYKTHKDYNDPENFHLRAVRTFPDVRGYTYLWWLSTVTLA